MGLIPSCLSASKLIKVYYCLSSKLVLILLAAKDLIFFDFHELAESFYFISYIWYSTDMMNFYLVLLFLGNAVYCQCGGNQEEMNLEQQNQLLNRLNRVTSLFLLGNISNFNFKKMTILSNFIMRLDITCSPFSKNFK